MLKASNNHFGNISKIKVPKIRPFCNLKSGKIAKKSGKYFQRQFWKIGHAKNIIKITPNKRKDQMHLLHMFFCYFKNATPFKIHAEYNYYTILPDILHPLN